MAFASQLYPKEFVIDDSNHQNYAPAADVVIDGVLQSRGRLPRDYTAVPLEGFRGAARFDLPVLSEQELKERIEELEKRKSRLSDLIRASGTKCKNQNGTNYCWINAPARSIEVVRMVQGLPFVEMSPASGGAQIKGFRNVGGWGTEALEWIEMHGLCDAKLWPVNAIDRRYLTPEAKANALLHRIPEWYDIPCGGDGGFLRMLTCLVNLIPVPIGLNWWGHEVLAVDGVVMPNGDLAVRIENSHGSSYGDQGMAVLNRRKGTPDDAVGPRVAIGSLN